MKRIGKIFLGVLCAAALAAGGFWINDRLSYPIDPGMDGLEGSLTNWLNRGIDAVHGYQPRLHEPVTLGERTYVPMEVGEKLGLEGRLQSRVHTKNLGDRCEERTAYEVSVMNLLPPQQSACPPVLEQCVF